MLHNDAREWVTELEVLKEVVLKHYQDLFSVDGDQCGALHVECPKFRLARQVSLDDLITQDEVHQALFQMKPWKAPSVDGFRVGAFQHFWGTMSSSLVNVVSNALESESFPTNLNETLLDNSKSCTP